MTLHHRLRRLEAGLRKDGRRCPLCRDRPGQVMVTTARIELPDNDRGDRQPCTDEPKGDSAEAAAPCPACGWKPDVVEITEVVIYSAEQLEQMPSGVQLRIDPTRAVERSAEEDVQ